MFATIADAQVVINEYCASSTSFLDEYGDNADWIELYNTSSADVNLEGWHLSDKAANLAKWSFPSYILKSGKHLLIFASGKDLYEYSAGDSIFYNSLVEATDKFSYAIGSSSISKDWYKADYDDSKWSVGKGGFGYGSSYAATKIPEGTISVFVRKEFNVNNLSTVKELFLDLDYDDGFVVYINGHEVARENLGSVGDNTPYDAVTPTYVNPLLANGSPLAHFDLSNNIKYLVEGENVLAIQIHNISETSSDLLLYPFLTAGSNVKGSKKLSELIDLQPKSSAKYFHTNFSISTEGEPIFLTNASGKIVHQTDSTVVPNDVSRGLSPDGSGKWVFFAEPTPNAANTTKAYASAKTNEVTFSLSGGLQTERQDLILTSAAGTPIYYTTDGSVPTKESKLYTEPLWLGTTTVVRAISYCDSLLPGQPATRSFIFPDHEITLPVMALVTASSNLYDYNYGIYVEGPNAEASDPHYGANYWQDWERPIHVEYYLPDGQNVINQDAGVKITGAYSRMSAQKSLAIHARKSYGKSHFDYQFFSSKNISSFKSFNLRNSGNDFGNTHIRDAMITNLVRNNNVDIQAYQPVVVYLNGNYWGIMNLRERLGKNYLEENFSYVDADAVDYIKNRNEVKEGSYEHYQAMLDFIQDNSLADDENYQYVKTLMDIDEYVEYMVTEIYCKNTDWPGNNIKYWRPQTADGRWRWMLFDTDFGFNIWSNNDYETDMISFCLASNSSGYANASWATFLLRNLVKNADFKRDFINRFADRLNCEFLPETVNALIDSLDVNITPEIKYHIKRWNHGESYRNDRLNAMRTFAEERPSYLREHIRDHFSAGKDVKITLGANDSRAGYIQLNSLTLNNFPWSGTYFSKVPVSLRAVARPGYKFVRWVDSDDQTVDTHAGIKVTLSKASRYTAVFEPSNDAYNSVVINEINFKSADDFDTKDWVELYNTTDAAINISGWKLADENLDEAFIIPVGTIIPPYGYVVVCANRSKLVSLNSGLQNVIGNFAFRLSGYDKVQLYDSEWNLVDDVEYNTKTWANADGNGYTLALTDPFADNAARRLWHANDLHGTPGAENGQFSPSHDDFSIGDDSFRVGVVEEHEVPESFAFCRPNPFHDNAEIVWNQAVASNTRVQVFSAQGVVLADFGSNFYAEGEHSLNLTSAVNWQPGLYFAKIAIDGCNPVIIKILRQ